ncbi:MAG TPA: ATP-grasp domain-containing protein [Candidatus Saccharimonadales bacterium]|nr:ATP-grasp domain-containing protein [Candidatus Saccharimonadales bacterium]
MNQKHVIVVYSYLVYPVAGPRYADRADFLNSIQGGHRNIQFYYGALSDFVYEYDGRDLHVTDIASGRDLASFDLVFFAQWGMLPQHAFAAATYLKQAGVPILREETVRQIPTSKLGELPLLVKQGLLVPKTVVAPLGIIKQRAKDKLLPFGFPFVLKSITGTQGSENFLIANLDDLKDKRDKTSASSFAAQEFIPNECDYRFAIADSEVLYVLRRSRSGDTHMNNTSQGGTAEFVDVGTFSEDVVDAAVQAADAVGRRDFAGVDIIITAEGKPYVLEVNSSPEIVTGFSAERKSKLLIQHMLRKLA